MKKGPLLVLIFLFLVSFTVRSQYYNTGQDPARLKWNQTLTPHFRIIYPVTFSAEAQKYARLLEESYSEVRHLYPGIKRRMPVIVHNYSMQSNGYVTWAPRRMELYPLPGQDNLPMDPAKQLVLHETAHVLQISSLNRGPGKVLSFFLGEQAMGMTALIVPAWAFEGDAVYAETVFTASGRGRSNVFLQGAKALTLGQEGIYGYDKLLSGSYRDFTPDHYVFGYLMMNKLRSMASFGERTAMLSVAGMPGNNHLSTTQKKKGIISRPVLFDSTFNDLEEIWSGHDDPGTFYNYPGLSAASRKDYVNHYLPQRIDGNSIISLKTSMSAPSAFVITNPVDGTEQLLTTTGYIYPYIFSYAGGTIVWSELHPDPRWDNLDYSVIKRMSISGGPVTQLTYRSRYTSPDLSPDGRTIAAVSSTPEFSYSLVLLDAFNGSVISEVAVPVNTVIQRPSWSSDGKTVTVVSLNDNGEGIMSYSLAAGEWYKNKPESSLDIIQAEFHDDKLLYLAQGDGSDNIYCIVSDSTNIRLTASRFGISGFSSEKNELLFSEYAVSGFRIASAKIDTAISPGVFSHDNFLPAITPVFPDTGEQMANDTSAYYTRPYNKLLHLVKPHSWMPFYVNISDVTSGNVAISPGFTLLSQNHLSTLTSTIGYEYAGGSHYLHSRLEWRGWYPVIDGGITLGGEQIVTKPSGVTMLPSDLKSYMVIDLNVSIPWYFSYGKFRQILMPAIYTVYRNNLTYMSDIKEYDEGNFRITSRLYFANTFRMAYRDIYPRWGQVIDLRLTAAPLDEKLYNSLKYVSATGFFPGLGKHHSLMVRAGYEDQSPARLLLHYNQNPYPRGYNNYISEKLFSLSADYTLPLFYPDLAAGRFLYLKRIRGSLFLDGATGWRIHDLNAGTYNEYSSDFGSFGGELLADFVILRFPFEISAGASGGYVPEENRYFVNAVFYANIYGNVLGRKR